MRGVVDGIVVSNHGGRQLDTARSGIEVLAEVVDALEAEGLWRNPRRAGGDDDNADRRDCCCNCKEERGRVFENSTYNDNVKSTSKRKNDVGPSSKPKQQQQQTNDIEPSLFNSSMFFLSSILGRKNSDSTSSSKQLSRHRHHHHHHHHQHHPTQSISSQQQLVILVDGGIRRGSDIFKALALGASAVGLGRPMLYAMSGYGQRGVERLIDILREELVMVMRLMGCPTIQDIRRDMVDTTELSRRGGVGLRDMLGESVYQPLSLVLPASSPKSKL